MEFYLQFGHGMMDISRQLIKRWGSGTVVLSPRDLEPEQLARFAASVNRFGGRCLLDPQVYEPRANWPRLCRHAYWMPEYVTSMLTDGQTVCRALEELKMINSQIQAPEIIVPGLFAEKIDDDWLYSQQVFLDEASTVFADEARLATVCLSAQALQTEQQVLDLISVAEAWDVSGYYVVVEHPNGQYLVEEPYWLSNLLMLCAGLKLHNRRVIVGYASHQLLCLAAANVDALAAGTWMNMRSFSTSRYVLPSEESTSRKAVWYYCPHSLSEYKPIFLDMGFRTGALEQLRPAGAVDGSYADVLFAGAQPSTTGFGETLAFLHYLYCMRSQADLAWRPSFQATLDQQELVLETAETFIQYFHSHGIRGQSRDFEPILDVNRSALAAFESEMAFVLNRRW